MVVSALLSAIHILTLALGLCAVFMRGQALARPLDDAGWRRLLAADNAWGIAAGLWIASGLARLFFGGKEPSFYWHNGFFWLKLTLFGLVFLLELTPMMTSSACDPHNDAAVHYRSSRWRPFAGSTPQKWRS